METAGKSCNKCKSNKDDAPKGLDDILEKDDIFSKREHPHVEKQVEPGKGDCEGADLPLDAGSDISLKKGDPIC